ncbi:MAG: hypothetical protein PHD58_01795 [Anaerolineales bacterium]|nr:hypothetical protein [Anaerolineales bacterium]
MSRANLAALALCLVAVLAAALVSELVFERMVHIEDEMAYVWQAQAIARGQLTLPSPPHPKSFLVPFVVDYNGLRFGKYPLGWPALLGIGVFLGLRAWINPLLAGVGMWFTYLLGKRLFGKAVGLLAAGLTLTSPFFLMNSGSLLSHPFGLALSAGFALSWLAAWEPHPQEGAGEGGAKTVNTWLPTLAAALSLGMLILTRPLTAVGVALPFTVHGVVLLVRGGAATRRRLLAFGAVVLAMAGLHFLWQAAVTGDALLNPYTLWWEYDKVGFGPGFGHTEEGHNLDMARVNTRFSLRVGRHDLFGWGAYSWIFLPFGLLATLYRRNWKALLALGAFPALVFVYVFYWIGSGLFGPRYYYEGLYSLTIASAAGIAWLAGWPTRAGDAWRSFSGWRRLRPLGVAALLALLVSANLLFYLPLRLGGMHGLYGVTRARLAPFQTEQAARLAPALVIVHPGKWTEYGSLLELQTPFLDTPFIFVYSRGAKENAALADEFPWRTIIHYYPNEPYTFYLVPR